MGELALYLGSMMCEALGWLDIAADSTCLEWTSFLGYSLLAASALVLGLALAVLHLSNRH